MKNFSFISSEYIRFFVPLSSIGGCEKRKQNFAKRVNSSGTRRPVELCWFKLFGESRLTSKKWIKISLKRWFWVVGPTSETWFMISFVIIWMWRLCGDWLANPSILIWDVPPSCSAAQPVLPVSHQPSQNQAEGGTKSTQPRFARRCITLYNHCITVRSGRNPLVQIMPDFEPATSLSFRSFTWSVHF